MQSPDPLSQSAADPAVLLRHFGGDVELFQELIELFLSDCPTRLFDVRAAVERRDGTTLARAAHAIKGSVGNFAAYPAVAAAQRLEILGRSEDWTEVDQALAKLETEVQDLIRTLHGFTERLAGRGDAHAES